MHASPQVVQAMERLVALRRRVPAAQSAESSRPPKPRFDMCDFPPSTASCSNAPASSDDGHAPDCVNRPRNR